MIKRIVLVVLAVAPVLALAGLATAGSGKNPDVRAARQATEQFRDLSVAEAAGYGLFTDKDGIACIDLPNVGGMGVHYVNGLLVGDAVVEPTKPEALVYAPARGGRLKLAAVEYVVFADVWHDAHGPTADPPSLFGVEFDFTPEGNRYGIPAFYALHAWLFQRNPAGQFTPWNPKVTCP